MNFKNKQLNRMVRFGIILAIGVMVNEMTLTDSCAQRGRGGRGGGGMSRGGGGYGGASRAPSYNRSPSMSRPSTPSYSRPSTANRGGMQSANRGGAANRGGVANQGGAVNRGGAANRGGATNRSAATGRAAQGAHPSQKSLNNFLNMPSQGGNRAGTGQRPAGGNAAVNDFFSHNASSANHNAAATHQSATGRQAGSVANQRSDNISNRTDTRSNARDSRGENRDFASDNRQDRVSDRGDNQAARVSTRGETRSSLAEGRGENRSERQQQRSEHADNIRDALEQEFDDNHLFDEFWKNNPEAYYRFNQNPAFWTWATAATVGSFFGAGYDSGGGGGGESYYDDGMVYSDGEQIPAEQYAEQAEEIVESAPEVENPDDMEWLPLGVFALADNENSDATPNMFLQLAVSKEGIVAGTFNNKSTDETKSVEGMVDMESGRAAWTIAGKSSPIMETKLEDLTENETNALVHFADGTTQEWLMLHMEKPADEE